MLNKKLNRRHFIRVLTGTMIFGGISFQVSRALAFFPFGFVKKKRTGSATPTPAPTGKFCYVAGLNDKGNLGLGDVVNRSVPTRLGTNEWTYITNTGGSNLKGATFALKADGSLWSWGDASDGDLGTPETFTNNRSFPYRVGTNTWKTVTGFRSRVLALRSDSTAWAWGALAPSGSASSPIQVGSASDWKEIGVGSNLYVLLKNDGTLWTFGAPGSTTHATATSVPTQVGTLSNWASITVGEDNVMAVKTDGSLWGWGNNNSGQLGNGTTVSESSPIRVGAGTDWAKVSINSATAAIKTDGSLWTWGNNSLGELGSGDLISRSSPVRVGAATNWNSVEIATGCFATNTAGEIYTWGANSSGELGQGDTASRSVPTRVGTDSDWQPLNRPRGLFLVLKNS